MLPAAPTPAHERTPVIFSYGLGADSTAILLRWLEDPATRDFDLEDLIVATAMTGDEWPVTGQLVEQHIVPRLREHGVRWIQAGRSQRRVTKAGEGVVIFEDSTAPSRVFLEGAYKLSDEMLEAGTVPQTGGARLCSVHAKGDVLDPIIRTVTGGLPYRHVMGFEAGELGRIRKDRLYNTATRTGEYPLLDWGWDRAACIAYIRDVTGVEVWPKSACTQCPFALCSRDGLAATLARYADEDPAAGVRALLMEHLAIALNPRQGLIAGDRLIDQLRRAPDRFAAVLELFERALEETPHAVYEVKRVYRPSATDPGKVANSARSIKKHAAGPRARLTAALAARVRELGVKADDADGIYRVYEQRREGNRPGVERFLVIAPAYALEKEHQSFGKWWVTAQAAAAAAARAGEQLALV